MSRIHRVIKTRLYAKVASTCPVSDDEAKAIKEYYDGERGEKVRDILLHERKHEYSFVRRR